MKERYIEVLKKYRKYLECSKNRFKVFETMNFDRLEQNNGNTWMVASILEKIIDYALIVEAFDDYEFHKIETAARIAGKEDIYQEAATVFCACHDLVSDAIDNNCKNPSFLIFKDFVDGYKLYEILIEGLCNSLEKMDDDEYRDEMIDLIDYLDSPVIDTEDELTAILPKEVSEKSTPEELLEYLAKVSKERFKDHLLMEDEDIVVSENILFKKPTKSCIDKNNNTMAEIFNRLNNADIEFSMENIEYLESLNTVYKQFKYYQYDYLKNKRTNNTMIEKCKLR